jgi:hypothetical protein
MRQGFEVPAYILEKERILKLEWDTFVDPQDPTVDLDPTAAKYRQRNTNRQPRRVKAVGPNQDKISILIPSTNGMQTPTNLMAYVGSYVIDDGGSPLGTSSLRISAAGEWDDVAVGRFRIGDIVGTMLLAFSKCDIALYSRNDADESDPDVSDSEEKEEEEEEKEGGNDKDRVGGKDGDDGEEGENDQAAEPSKLGGGKRKASEDGTFGTPVQRTKKARLTADQGGNGHHLWVQWRGQNTINGKVYNDESNIGEFTYGDDSLSAFKGTIKFPISSRFNNTHLQITGIRTKTTCKFIPLVEAWRKYSPNA